MLMQAPRSGLGCWVLTAQEPGEQFLGRGQWTVNSVASSLLTSECCPLDSPEDVPAFHPKHRMHLQVVLGAIILHPERPQSLLTL